MTTRAGDLLVVDDNEMNRDMLSRRLDLNGYTVTTAEGGRQALELIGGRPFDLVLLDVMMPDVDGLEVLRTVRERFSPAELPVMMLTAKDRSEEIVEALSAGANDYVTKPIDFPVVLARVATQVACKRALAALSESQSRFALAAQGTNDGLWDWDIPADSVYFAPRWKAMLGHHEDEVGTCPSEWFRRIHPDDLVGFQADLAAHLQGLTPHFEHEHRLFHADRTYRWMLSRGLAVRGAGGRLSRMAGSLTDITAGKVADALTGLPNRAYFTDCLERAIERSRRQPDSRFAVLFLDLDRFKVINDSLGHLIGDQLLIAVARRLEEGIRATDTISRPGQGRTVARLGGDEFTILLEGINGPDGPAKVADRIEEALAAPFLIGGHEVYTTSSIGIALGGPDSGLPEDLLRDADMAMYTAKSRGKARHEVFDAEMRDRAQDRLRLETELRQALDRGEFLVQYQPIVEMKTERLQGFEALVRWRHPERGLLGPGEFLESAEETGLIVPLGWWVLEESCRQMAAWRSRFPADLPLIVNVNISGKQFLQPGFVEQVERRLGKAGLDPRDLNLEITEGAIIGAPEVASAIIARLRDLGVRISIDDFGTGYSSLNYLRQFPVDALKIDRSFIANLEADGKDSEIVRTILTLAQVLRLDVVAEGIETIHQLDHLRDLGCKKGQGFLFSRSLDGDAAEELVALSLLTAIGKADPKDTWSAIPSPSCSSAEAACSAGSTPSP